MTKRANLTDQDLAALGRSFITPELAEQARLFRVTSAEGAEIIGRNGRGDYEGIVFPYFWPGETEPRQYRLRRDRPDVEEKADGTLKEKGKYLSPPGGQPALLHAGNSARVATG